LKIWNSLMKESTYQLKLLLIAIHGLLSTTRHTSFPMVLRPSILTAGLLLE
jgi:hypothetical protein